jgi:hypothetical protein
MSSAGVVTMCDCAPASDQESKSSPFWWGAEISTCQPRHEVTANGAA